jgi:uncharacterized repeat protein (TIGR01451 family)
MPIQRLLRTITAVFTLAAISLSVYPVHAAGQNAVLPGSIRADATFEHIGAVWTITGDDNHNSQLTLAFRASGETAWHPGAPAMRAIPDLVVDGEPLGLNYWAASALFLQPGQSYELRLTLTDPDGGGATQVVNAATRSMLAPDPAGRQLSVVPGSGGGAGTPTNPFRGLQAAANAAQPGDVFHLAAGTYAPFQLKTSGTPGHPIVFHGPPSGTALVDGGGTDRGVVTLGEYGLTTGYVILSGLIIQNGAWGIDAQNTQNILISHNTITDVANGILNRRDDALEANQTIADNVIQGRTAWPGEGIPEEEGIDLRGSGNVVAYNRVQHFGDCISVNPSTGPSFGNDVVGNDVAYCVDDGIEIDDNQANARTWRNRVMDSRMGVSVQPIRGGPAYIFRNEFFNLESNPIKMHNDTTGFWVAHNTGAKLGNGQGDDGTMWRNAVYRNNLFLGTRYAFEFTTAATDGFRDLDYNAWGTTHAAGSPSDPDFKWDDVRYLRLPNLQAIGVETHGIMAKFGDLVNAALPADWDVNVVPGSRDLRLSGSVPEINAGADLPNLNDPFVTDGHADMGAFEAGSPQPTYGPRTLVPDLSASSMLVSHKTAHSGDTLIFTIRLQNSGLSAAGVQVHNTLPAGLIYQGNLSATSGSAAYSDGTVIWTGDVAEGGWVSITYQAQIDPQIVTTQLITNAASIDDGNGTVLLRQVVLFSNGFELFLPLINR